MIVGCPFCGTLHEETEERAQSHEPMDRACAKCYLADKARDTDHLRRAAIIVNRLREKLYG